MRQRGSMTVEASLVLPLFIFAMVLVCFLGKLVQCQDDVSKTMCRVVREASAEYGATQSKLIKNQAYYIAKMNLYLQGTGINIMFLESKLMKENDEIDLIANYKVDLPFRILSFSNVRFRQRVHSRAFVGVESRGGDDKKIDKTVYVTPTGRVYHTDATCTYLKLTISMVMFLDIENLRNQSGGKYKKCEVCVKRKIGSSENVWITNYGDRYHITKSCSGIKRTPLTMKLSEVGDRTMCSKCRKKEEG